MTYRIEYTASAARELRELSEREHKRIWERVQKLAHNPRPPGAKALKGDMRGLFRIRVGDYRVAYQILDDEVVVARVDKRSRIYKRMA